MISPASLGCSLATVPGVMPVPCGNPRPTGSAPSFVMPASVMEEAWKRCLELGCFTNNRLGHWMTVDDCCLGRKCFWHLHLKNDMWCKILKATIEQTSGGCVRKLGNASIVKNHLIFHGWKGSTSQRLEQSQVSEVGSRILRCAVSSFQPLLYTCTGAFTSWKAHSGSEVLRMGLVKTIHSIWNGNQDFSTSCFLSGHW